MPAFVMIDGGSTAPYRYFRLNMTKTQASNYVAISELEIMVTSTAYPTSNMTTNTAPTPLVASASSEYSASYQAWQGFDGSSAGEWVASVQADGAQVIAQWLQVDLGSGNAIAATSYKITPSSVGGRYAPYDFTLQGSNDGSSWAVINTQTGLSSGWSGGVAREFTI